MDRKIPHKLFPMQYFLLTEVTSLYQMAGDTAMVNKFSQYTLDACNDLVNKKGFNEFVEERYPRPMEIMLNMYELREDYTNGLALLNKIAQMVQRDPNQTKLVKEKVYEMQIKRAEKEGKYKEALDVIDQALTLIGPATDQNSAMSRQNFEMMRAELQQKAGIVPKADSAAPHM